MGAVRGALESGKDRDACSPLYAVVATTTERFSPWMETSGSTRPFGASRGVSRAVTRVVVACGLYASRQLAGAIGLFRQGGLCATR
jgi:hypothetical protein